MRPALLVVTKGTPSVRAARIPFFGAHRDLNRFEERIRRQEAMARGMAEVSASSLEDQFADLEDTEDEMEVEARLAALKSQG